jgi:ATP adenylyltransferase
LNPDAALRVADVSDTHVCLLNRFPVFKRHLLIVTRNFEDQAEPLNIDDFQAIWKCMAEYEALGFYNGGPSAGASQRHKHLQMVSLPLAPCGPGVPIEPLLDLLTITGDVGCSSQLPFPHCVAPLPSKLEVSTTAAAELTLGLYHRMLGEIGLDPATPRRAYNLLLTRRWMLLVPRSREKFAAISLNALAFAGHFLVQSRAELEVLQERGPLSVLQYVASP